MICTLWGLGQFLMRASAALEEPMKAKMSTCEKGKPSSEETRRSRMFRSKATDSVKDNSDGMRPRPLLFSRRDTFLKN